jgi:hypothetical protein
VSGNFTTDWGAAKGAVCAESQSDYLTFLSEPTRKSVFSMPLVDCSAFELAVLSPLEVKIQKSQCGAEL